MRCKMKLTENYRDMRKHIVITNELHDLIVRTISVYKQKTHQNITGGQVVEKLLNGDTFITDIYNSIKSR